MNNEEPVLLDEVMTQLDTLHLWPNVRTLELIMKSDGRKGDLAAVERAFSLLNDLRIRPTFDSLILAQG